MEPFIGLISMFGGNFAPRGWALCNGQLMSISQNSALFSILGTTYGGDGQTTFGLPNLQGRVAVHAGQSPGTSSYQLGQVGGTENVSLLAGNLPAHTHMVSGSQTPTSSDPAGLVPANENVSRTALYGAPDGTLMSPAMNSMVGGNLPFGIVQPYECVNFIIALEGVFPSRS
ncbi:MAG: tail fiber protein [Bryobacteraceae bacterium]